MTKSMRHCSNSFSLTPSLPTISLDTATHGVFLLGEKAAVSLLHVWTHSTAAVLIVNDHAWHLTVPQTFLSLRIIGKNNTTQHHVLDIPTLGAGAKLGTCSLLIFHNNFI